jgi:hypothetical protein
MKESSRSIGEVYDVCSQCARIIALGSTEDPKVQAQYWYKMNIFLLNEDISDRPMPLLSEPMLKDLTMHGCEIVAECPVGSIQSTARVVHYGNYNGTSSRGVFKTFHFVTAVVCGGGFVARAITTTDYI